MGRFGFFYKTLIGKKIVMALSGVILVLFLVGHLAGNLQIFAGREPLNRYAEFLKGAAEILWVVRIAMFVFIIAHIIAGLQVWWANRRARPVGYVKRKDIETGWAARTMILSGPLILVYIVYHLMMFTFLTTGPGYSQTDVYQNEILSFQVPAISIVYIISMLAVGFHLYHGIWSMLHTLGFAYPTWRPLRRVCVVIAVLITLGYISIPVAVLAGWVS